MVRNVVKTIPLSKDCAESFNIETLIEDMIDLLNLCSVAMTCDGIISGLGCSSGILHLEIVAGHACLRYIHITCQHNRIILLAVE